VTVDLSLLVFVPLHAVLVLKYSFSIRCQYLTVIRFLQGCFWCHRSKCQLRSTSLSKLCVLCGCCCVVNYVRDAGTGRVVDKFSIFFEIHSLSLFCRDIAGYVSLGVFPCVSVDFSFLVFDPYRFTCSTCANVFV